MSSSSGGSGSPGCRSPPTICRPIEVHDLAVQTAPRVGESSRHGRRLPHRADRRLGVDRADGRRRHQSSYDTPSASRRAREERAREEHPPERRQRRPPQRRVVRAPRPRRLPASLVAQVDRRDRRGVPRAPGDRDLQQLERARQLQRPPARAGGVGEARRAPGGRLPARVPGAVARRVADEADDDALPEPDGDGRRGVDPRVSARRRRAAHGLRQDEPREHHGRRERGHPGDRRHGRADAERPLARAARSARAATAGTTTRSCARDASRRRSGSRSRTRCRARTATA